MATVPRLEDAFDIDDSGRLANNFMTVQALQTALSHADMDAGLIPKLATRAIKEGVWREWLDGYGVYHARWKKANPADFREFIRTPRPDGCQCPIHVFERMILDTPAWDIYQGMLRGEPGNPIGRVDAPRDARGAFTSNRDNITVTGGDPPDTIPFTVDPAPPPTPDRDYRREAPTGTSTSYALRQLENGRKRRNGEHLPPRPDLLERVKAGEMSPRAACVEAGFVEKQVSINIESAESAERTIRSNASPEFIRDLVRRLSDG